MNNEDEEEKLKRQIELVQILEKESEERNKMVERNMKRIATILLWNYLTDEERKEGMEDE